MYSVVRAVRGTGNHLKHCDAYWVIQASLLLICDHLGKGQAIRNAGIFPQHHRYQVVVM